MKVFGITGWKNSGKTTLVEKVVAEIAARGFSVSTVKHAHHGFDVDQPGRDSYRHREAGARQVLVASSNRWALMTELRDAAEPGLDDLLAQLQPVDIVIVEGYKTWPHDKIEARRAETAQAPIAPSDPAIRAIASDGPLPDPGVPVLDLNDVSGITDFILAHVGLQ
ncbi:molybdopterin-guanine dinucleotide biosynthesis protein B [Amaricoccus tamworthensis]|uniref:molybdopterin-guanine dinucleotide biosynthesis protein B n=1 Tax=Amaricoccus tamworthensis TaxID=57002 RepID=UPI003C7C3AB7